jgi:hypothetical protein
MKALTLAAIGLALGSCSSPAEREHNRVMDQIEARVHLPAGARRLQNYARYYAYGDHRNVIAEYVIPMNDAPQPGEICEDLSANFTSQKVPCQPFKTDWAMPAGERRWMADQGHLPGVSDGGCSVVVLEFDLKNSEFTHVACNGVG